MEQKQEKAQSNKMEAVKTSVNKTEVEEKRINEKEVLFMGKKIIVKRLPALLYYRANKHYIRYIKKVIEFRKKNLSTLNKLSKNVKDIEKDGVGLDVMLGLVENYGDDYLDDISSIVAYCTGLKKEEVLNSYTEDLHEVFIICLSLNRFSSNLKNSLAPMKSLGA